MSFALHQIRVLVADDHPSVRENLRYLLNAEKDISVVAVARDGVEAVVAAREFTPDVVVADSDMPNLDGIDLVLRLRYERPQTRVVIFTADADVCPAALEAGAFACISKDTPSAVLVDAIRAAFAGPGRRKQQRSHHVLVVDDEADVLRTVREVLEDAGFAVHTATNGAEALREVERVQPAVILLDMRMPVLDGPDFVNAIRARGVDIPIVVMSAGDRARELSRTLSSSDYVSKPLEPARLLEIARRYVSSGPGPAHPA